MRGIIGLLRFFSGDHCPEYIGQYVFNVVYARIVPVKAHRASLNHRIGYFGRVSLTTARR